MKVYGSVLSPSYRRVCIAAAELGIPLEKIVLDIRAGQNRTPEYLAKNPMGKIATFEDDDGWCLWESPAILAYLGEKFAAKGLWPDTVRGRADALRWLFWNASHLEPAGSKLVGEIIFKPMRGGTPDEAVLAAGHKDLERYLPILEQQLASREFVLGAPSLVDIALGTTGEYLLNPKLGFSLAPYPAISAWLARLTTRPSWKVE